MRTREQGNRRSGRRYAEIAAAANGGASHPEPVAYATSLGYSEEDLKTVPAEAVMSLGCGTPVNRARLRRGEIVLDLGSGGGLDAFLAARRVGPTGRVIGVDVTLEMVKRANETAEKSRIANVEFRHAPIERLPLADFSVDVAISNCVMNHCADKVRAFKEVYRVLKVGGRMCLSDLVVSGPFSEAALADEVWGEWLRVARSKNDYLRAIEQAGFQEVTVEAEGTFNMAENDERLKGRIVSISLTARKDLANAGGLPQLPMRTRWAARVARFWRKVVVRLPCSVNILVLTAGVCTGCVIPWPRSGEVVVAPDVRGRVLDSLTGQPVWRAEVTVDARPETRVFTEADGTFHISEVRKRYRMEFIEPGGVMGHCPPVGSVFWSVMVTMPGYRDCSASIFWESDESRSSTNRHGPFVLNDILLSRDER